MRVLLGAALGVVKPCLLQQLHHAFVGFGSFHHVVRAQGFFHLGADAPYRVEVTHRVLRHQADVGAAVVLHLLVAQPRNVLTIEQNRAASDFARTGKQPDHRHRRGGLA